MRATDAALAGVALGMAVFSAVYFADPPAPKYLPLEGGWTMRPPQGALAMGWYGRSAWGLGAGLLAGTAVCWVRRPGVSRSEERVLGRWTARALTVLALVSIAALAIHLVAHEFSRFGVFR